jgi:hypothetical protein
MLEYTPSNVAIDRTKDFTGDGDIPIGPAGGHTVVLLDGSTASVTATLPSAPLCISQTYTIKCINATNQCGFIAKTPDKVDNSAALVVLGLYVAKTVRSDGLNW